MKTSDEHTQVFIVRIWREPREIEGAPPEWRGVIEHVGSGERRFLKELENISAFVAPHLQRMGIRVRQPRLRRWLKRFLFPRT
jgi:hypothetical protein